MNNSTTHCIYRIVCFQTGKVYVGQSISPTARQSAHFSKLAKGTHHSPSLQLAFDKYGRSSFYFEIIERDILYSKINEREQYWVDYFDSYRNGYNATPGGDERGGKRVRPCTWNGIEYESISAAARACGLTAKAIRQRLQRGYTQDSDFKTYYKPCEWNGIKYPSVKAAAKANGYTKSQMEQRIRRGYTSDSDVHNPNKSCVWNGVHYASVKEAAKVIGVSPQAMGDRLLRGYSQDSDLKRPK